MTLSVDLRVLIRIRVSEYLQLASVAVMERSHDELWDALVVAVLTIAVVSVGAWLRKLVWEPMKMRRIMTKQGVAVTPFHILFGNIKECVAYAAKFPEDCHVDGHYECTPTVYPQHALYFPKHGSRFVYEWGSETRLAVRDPEFVREVLSTKQAYFRKPEFHRKFMGEVVGQKCMAIVEHPPTHQSHRRKLYPFFYPEALKAMVDAMVEGATYGIQKLDEKVREGGGSADLDVLPDLYSSSNQVLTRTMLSSDVERGREIYKCQTQLVEILYGSLSKLSFWIPGYRFFPTKDNREIASLKREMRNLLTEIIGARKKAFDDGIEGGYGDDLLGHMLMTASAPDGAATGAAIFDFESVVDNTQMFYIAGQDTVAAVAGFSMLMLARHPEWQDRAHKEVHEVWATGTAIDASGLNRLKIMGMVINETLRLFGSLPRIPKVAVEDVQVKDLFIPKGLTIEIAVQSMHLDTALWGEDALKFNPERFANGAANACTHPQAFLPFSAGFHYCLGSNYALMEIKILLAMILQRFQILVSPHYKHHPYFAFIQRPKYGLQVILKAL